jgi:hypothetical protein
MHQIGNRRRNVTAIREHLVRLQRSAHNDPPLANGPASAGSAGASCASEGSGKRAMVVPPGMGPTMNA